MRYHPGLLLAMAALTVGASAGVLDDQIDGRLDASFQSKWLSYGLVDGDEPIFQPGGSLTFAEHVTFATLWYFDLTSCGERAGRGDQNCNFWEIDFPVDVRHVFREKDHPWLPTSVELGSGYRYEYYPRRTGYRDAQFWLVGVSLPDLWLVPALCYEREVVTDNGTYLNFSLSHEFALTETVALMPSVSQGWGDRKRVRGYLSDGNGHGLDRAGLMDFRIQLTLTWRPLENLEVSAFAAYSDFPFDRHIREAARRYQSDNAGYRIDAESWNFIGGLAVGLLF